MSSIDQALRQALDEGWFRLGSAGLREAVAYALLGPGKRLRPLLAWHSARAVGGDGPESLAAGVAVEMVHAFSLVHDDLPALDNDDLRRGRPTLHKHAGEAMAILAGDALLNGAFEVLAERGGAHAGALVLELARGTAGMIDGQVWDTLKGLPPELAPGAQVELIHRNKTGALIRAACRMGAISAGADPRALRAITDFAEPVGLAFQIVDDLLDVTQSAEQLGKRSGKDLEAGKLTYPGTLGLEASRRAVDELSRKAQDSLGTLGSPASGLAALSEYMGVRTR